MLARWLPHYGSRPHRHGHPVPADPALPSAKHEALLLLLRNRPSLAPELLSTLLSVPLPPYDQVRFESAELAVMSAMAHGKGEHALQVALAALEAARALDDERARLHADLAVSWLGKAARRALEDMMETGSYQYQSDFARRYVAQGRAEGRAEAVLTVLRARQLEVSPEAQQRIAACTDLAQLDDWTRRAITVQAVEELFD